MAEPNRSLPSASATAAATASSSSNYRENASAGASSPGTSYLVHEEEEPEHDYPDHHHFHNPELENQHYGVVSFRENFTYFDDSSTLIRDDTWSCIIVILTFWFFGLYLFSLFFSFTFLVNLSFLKLLLF